MSEQEQNKYINQLRRQLTNAVERIKTLELDVEPDGRISEAFSVMEDHMDTRFDRVDEQFDRIDARFDRVDARLDRMEHQFNQLQAKLEIVLDAITGIGDLPEE
jgi:septation ring formation regulator EzrA